MLQCSFCSVVSNVDCKTRLYNSVFIRTPRKCDIYSFLLILGYTFYFGRRAGDIIRCKSSVFCSHYKPHSSWACMHGLHCYETFISYKYSSNKGFPASSVMDEFSKSKLYIEKRRLQSGKLLLQVVSHVVSAFESIPRICEMLLHAAWDEKSQANTTRSQIWTIPSNAHI